MTDEGEAALIEALQKIAEQLAGISVNLEMLREVFEECICDGDPGRKFIRTYDMSRD